MLEVQADVILNWSEGWEVQVLPDYMGEHTEISEDWVFIIH
jgi:hypothetical protein